jgi:hypothetical protein
MNGEKEIPNYVFNPVEQKNTVQEGQVSLR